MDHTVKQSCQTLDVDCVVASHVHCVTGLPQKKGRSPFIVKQREKLKYGVSCIDQLSSVPNVTSFHTVAENLPVGAKLKQFWKT